MSRKMKSMLVVLGILTVIVFLLPNSGSYEEKTVSYSEFMSAVEDGSVVKVEVDVGTRTLSSEKKDGTVMETQYAGIDNIAEQLRKSGVTVDVKATSGDDGGVTGTVFRMLIWILALVLIFAFIGFFMKRAGGGIGGAVMTGFAKSPLKRFNPDEIGIGFGDVLGADEAVAGVREYKDFLVSRAKFASLNARLPKGVLFVGPPGTGKTLLAKATACEAGVPFFYVSGANFVEMFVGVGAARVRSMEEELRKNAPCIVFIDELDAVGRNRGSGIGNTNDERETTLNQLLVVMDGIDPGLGVVFMAATNRPDVLDPALTRAGRFDRTITMPLPDIRGREAILFKYAVEKPLWDDVNLDVIARLTPGCTGADLENLVNEAALLAARRDREYLTMHDLNDALDKLLLGSERSVVMPDSVKLRVCAHEAGHAIVSMFTEGPSALHKVSVIPRERSLGITVQVPESEILILTKDELESQVLVYFGGRSAEKAVFGDLSTGASDDLHQATRIVRDMVMRYGMSDKLGPMSYASEQGPMFLGRELTRGRDHSDITARAIEEEVRRILVEKEKAVDELLAGKQNLLSALASALYERETMSRKDIEELFQSIV